jgi:hypothetical protein
MGGGRHLVGSLVGVGRLVMVDGRGKGVGREVEVVKAVKRDVTGVRVLGAYGISLTHRHGRSRRSERVSPAITFICLHHQSTVEIQRFTKSTTTTQHNISTTYFNINSTEQHQK